MKHKWRLLNWNFARYQKLLRTFVPFHPYYCALVECWIKYKESININESIQASEEHHSGQKNSTLYWISRVLLQIYRGYRLQRRCIFGCTEIHHWFSHTRRPSRVWAATRRPPARRRSSGRAARAAGTRRAWTGAGVDLWSLPSRSWKVWWCIHIICFWDVILNRTFLRWLISVRNDISSRDWSLIPQLLKLTMKHESVCLWNRF